MSFEWLGLGISRRGFYEKEFNIIFFRIADYARCMWNCDQLIGCIDSTMQQICCQKFRKISK